MGGGPGLCDLVSCCVRDHNTLLIPLFLCGGFQVSSSSGSWIACKTMGPRELFLGLYKILDLFFWKLLGGIPLGNVDMSHSLLQIWQLTTFLNCSILISLQLSSTVTLWLPSQTQLESTVSSGQDVSSR